MAETRKRSKKAHDFSAWYTSTLLDARMVDYTAVSGAVAFMPDCYFIWESIQKATDAMLRQAGVQNSYFPIFIPERLLAKEQAHVEGFTPEVAWVTHAGDTKLSERLAVRPTSEAIMYDSFARWIRSWRDLPLRLNQWNSAVRWEFKHPMLLIRNREFLWNEGHSVFATEAEALAERDMVLEIYKRVLRDYMALPGIVGRKSEREKFAGAEASFSIELMMPDGWAIQGPIWHFDGQNFSRAYGIEFLDKDGEKRYAWQNTYAISTRMLGVMFAVHGDDNGLVIPPRLSRIQAVIVPIYTESNRDVVLAAARSLCASLSSGLRVHVDERDYTPGRKFNEWELKGVPLRLELGEKELAARAVTVFRRDVCARTQLAIENIGQRLDAVLSEMHGSMLKRASEMLKQSMHAARSMKELIEAIDARRGMAHAPWCGGSACEESIRAETGAKITNMPLDQSDLSGSCVYCGKPARHMANIARSY